MPKAGRLHSTERFLAEARRVARLKHPGVVAVFDVGQERESCFIVSEFVEDGSLADRIATNRPAHQDAARMVAEIAETLAYAHRQGFVHRDIKPGNILLDHHGRALLTDFGIAHSPDDGIDGGSFGTLAYMSPEQVEGKPVDHRTDIYGLGGRPPRTAHGPPAARRHRLRSTPQADCGGNGGNYPRRVEGGRTYLPEVSEPEPRRPLPGRRRTRSRDSSDGLHRKPGQDH